MHELWAILSHSVRGLITTHPLVAIAAILFGEELGIPSPIPGDVLMILAGVEARRGMYSFGLVLLVQEVATLLGATGLFLFSRRYGRAAVTQYGWLLHLGPAMLAKAEATLQRSGWRAIVIGRLLPGLRIITPIAAGVCGTSLAQFVPAVAVGAFLYILVLDLFGFLVGPTALALFARIALPVGALVSLAVAALCLFLMRSVKHQLPTFARGGGGAAVAARLDGLLAGIGALLVTNGVVGLANFVARFFGYEIPLGTEEIGTPLRLLLGGPVFLLIASLLGVVDEWLGAERLHWFLRSIVMAGLPLVLVLAIAVPLAASNLVPLAERRGEFLIAVEVLRWIVFGVALGELLPLDARLHQNAPTIEGAR